MTTTIAHEVSRRSKPKHGTMAEDLSAMLFAGVEESRRLVWPSPRFREDPVAFFRLILGIDPWWRQVQILEAVRDHPRVAVSSGHKVSKSCSAAGIALWYYCSFPEARAVLSSTTARQVDQILWRELRMMVWRSGKCLDCRRLEEATGKQGPRPCPHSALIDGEIHELARSGLKSVDFREVVGFTAREAEAVAGVSGRNLLYIMDEASGIPDEIFEATEGNRAGGARLVLFGNPTRNGGEFFDAFYRKAEFYRSFRISSEETPNVVEGRDVIPGLATRDWVEEKKREWGEDSAIYKVRIRGEHALQEEGKIFSLHMIEQAEERWHETPERGRLSVGLDPAGPGGHGDDSAFVPRRGLKVLDLDLQKGLDKDGHLAHLLVVLNKYRLPREIPIVLVDVDGVGLEIHRRFALYLEEHPGEFELVSVRASDRASRDRKQFVRRRDELVGNLEQWFRDGGAIPENARLERELHAPDWIGLVDGRRKVTEKPELRKRIGHSPDLMDGLSLAVWEPNNFDTDLEGKAKPTRDEDDDGEQPDLNPYAGVDFWEGKRR